MNTPEAQYIPFVYQGQLHLYNQNDIVKVIVSQNYIVKVIVSQNYIVKVTGPAQTRFI